MLKISKSISTFFVVAYAFFLTNSFAVAQFSIGLGKVDTMDQISNSKADLIDVIVKGLNWATGLVALGAVAFLIFSGVKYVTSNGDEKKVEEANRGIINAIIGLAICFAASLVVNFVIRQLKTITT